MLYALMLTGVLEHIVVPPSPASSLSWLLGLP